MKSKLLLDRDGQRTFAVVFDTGDEVAKGLLEFARRQHLAASQFTAIGAFSDAVIAYFRWDTRQYMHIPIPEQTEVLTCAGDVTVSDDGPQVHAHVVLGKSDGSAHGGHLIEAHVRPTLEVVLTESPAHLRRRRDQRSGLSLIHID
jgi:predicted DNA-binding protein with PD1-like motif